MPKNLERISLNKLDKIISYCKENKIDYITLNSKLSNQIKNYIEVSELNDEIRTDEKLLSPAFKIGTLNFYSSPIILWDDTNLYCYKNNSRVTKFDISTKD